MYNIRYDMKQHLATASFVCAVIFAMAGLCIPPTGVIHSSVLMLVAQLFVLTATLLGVDSYSENIRKLNRK